MQWNAMLGAAAFATMLVPPSTASAATDAEITELRGQIRQVRESYEARIQALEQRLKQLEGAPRPDALAAARPDESTQSKQSKQSKQAKQIAPASSAGPNRVAGEGAFNPAISVVLNGAYGNFSQDPQQYAISGFVPPGNGLSPGERGLSVRESELALAANIDTNFRGNLLLAFDAENQVGVEEAYVQSIGLGHGLSLKGGRFFSAIGYLNEIHSHAWDFADAPLAYRAFLGGENYADDGIQFKWLAPMENLVELGGEIGRGRNPPGSNRNKNGSSAGSVFARFGGDIGESHAYRLGLSALGTSPRGAAINDIDAHGFDVVNTFSGTSRLAIADFVYKYAPGGNARDTSLKLQGEYFRRRENGTLTIDTAGIAGEPARNSASDYSTTQSGWYLQGVYQFMPQWRLGLRFDRLDRGTVEVGAGNAGSLAMTAFNPSRASLMVDYSPSEFSRFRLQFARDKSRENLTDNQVVLQYIFSLGAHGGHKF